MTAPFDAEPDRNLVPNARESELAVLASIIESPKHLKAARGALTVEDFYYPRHARLWSVLLELDDAGQALDRSVVAAHLLATNTGLLPLLAELSSGLSVNLGWHLKAIEQAAVERALRETLTYGLQLATDDNGRDPIAVASETIERLQLLQHMTTAGPTTAIDVLDLIRREISEDDWIIPEMLARNERIIITAPEGYGKSTLIRQITACIASGWHPFVKEPLEPRRCLVIDAENPQAINTTEYREMVRCLDDGPGVRPSRGMLTVDECGPTNVLDPRIAARFLEMAADLRPDVITIGPLYQLHDEDPNLEGPARKLAGFLDRLRAVCGSALITEAHTPHNDGPGGQMLRPYGASLWKRWPEFGYCLHPAESVKRMSPDERRQVEGMRASSFSPWRGNRGKARRWPRALEASLWLPWAETL